MATKSTHRLIVFLPFSSLPVIVHPRLRDKIDVPCYSSHHRSLGPVVDLTWTLATVMLS